MTRIALFLLTNLAVIVIANITLNLLGVASYLYQPDSDLDMKSLLFFCAAFGFSSSFVSLFISKWMAKRATGIRLINTPHTAEEGWLLETVRDLADKAKIGRPEVGIFPAQQSNAFATGWNSNNALVAVSAGLLHRFDKNEVRAVLGHEIGHVTNGDMTTLALVRGVVNTFVMFFARIIGNTVDRVILKNERGHGIGFYITTFVAELVLAFLANMIVARFSHKREFRAYVAGANLCDKHSMISALRRLQSEARQPIAEEMPDTLKAFAISSNFSTKMMAAFATHPPLELRFKALEMLS
jgi:heat shock protein HtpX